MCGRYAFYSGENFYERFNVDNRIDLKSNYNASPGQDLPVVFRDRQTAAFLMRWGLIPSWAKDASIGNHLINARADSVTTKPSFRKSFKSQRCLVPANGFFEWKKVGKQSLPYYFKFNDERLFSFAGIFDIWDSPDGSPIFSYAIITTDPSPVVSAVHNRMPVLLDRNQEKTWLDPSTPSNKLNSLLSPYPGHDLLSYPVSSRVNTSRENTPDLIRPI